ncbi:MAG TPA: NADP-dependent oxidoreductase [Polyangia bacterium]|jgi:NADPH:quinone reductase-like Zn-dependent oxidoreductase|nr:NADP-dependent oxidoreductase [Polyangia bacterium]
MDASIPESMNAAVIDRYGGPEVLHLEALPVPEPKRNEVLIRVEAAGIGAWDPYVRTGELKMREHQFPEVMGNDGAGTVVAVGAGVSRFRRGDRVYASTEAGGFYAEYVAVDQENVAPIPRGLDARMAGALGFDGITALRGLEDQLGLRAGETVMIFGASGGIGHLAVQLAKRQRARVVAVASGTDGVELVRRLGADLALDGRADGIAAAIRAFVPAGLDAALVLAGGDALDEALTTMKKGGRLAYPNGVEPAPRAPDGIEVRGYDGAPDREVFERLNRRIEPGPFHVELARVYRLEQAGEAHREIGKHHLGKLAFQIEAS